MKTEFQNITPETAKLLDKEEGTDVDFKVDGIDAEDIVAFANSKNGGVILIGVEEIKDGLGRVRGKVVGTRVGDNEKLRIINKALDCLPPIQVNIIYENISDKPIMRVEIPRGAYRPYCTKKGVYKTRNDGRNQALTSDQLFDIFLEREYKSFIDKFKEATKELKDDVTEIASQLEGTEHRITTALDHIESSVGSAESDAYDAVRGAEDVQGAIQDLEEKVSDLGFKIERSEERELLILKHLGIEDPKMTRLKQAVKNAIVDSLSEAKKKGKKPVKKKIIDDIEVRIKKAGHDFERVEIESIYFSCVG